MEGSEKAGNLFERIKSTLSDPASTEFFRENRDLGEFVQSAIYVAIFVVDRPVLAIVDGINEDRLIELMVGEKKEAEREQAGSFKLFSELGDTVFFSLLVGVLYWQQLSAEQKEVLLGTIKWSRELAEENHFDVENAVQYVSQVKDPINYRKELYQIDQDETTENVVIREEKIRGISRYLRDRLNGHLRDGDIVENLMREKDNPDNDLGLVRQIEALFMYALVDESNKVVA